jgi:hypothetical protein
LLPGMDTLGLGNYALFAFFMSLVYNVVFFSLDMFSFFNFLAWGAYILSSTLLTTVLILVIENVRRQ